MKAVQYNLNGVKTVQEAFDMTPEIAWEAAPVGLMTENGISVNDHRAIIRTDTNACIGVVGNRYFPLQNSFAFSFFDSVCQQYDAKYDKAYCIDGGKRVILEATVNGPIEIRKNDTILRKIKLINSFDGSMPFVAQFTEWRQICKNGLMGFAKTNKVKVSHTKNGEIKAAEALRIMNESAIFFENFEHTCRELAQKVLDKNMVDAFLKGVDLDGESTKTQNLRDKVIELYENGTGTGQGTAWDLYNGYIEWIDHHRSSNPESRLANAVLAANGLKEQAFDVITKI